MGRKKAMSIADASFEEQKAFATKLEAYVHSFGVKGVFIQGLAKYFNMASEPMKVFITRYCFNLYAEYGRVWHVDYDNGLPFVCVDNCKKAIK